MQMAELFGITSSENEVRGLYNPGPSAILGRRHWGLSFHYSGLAVDANDHYLSM